MLIKSSRPRSDKFKELCNLSSEFGETNDCSVKAVALSCGVSYAEAHKACAAQGRKQGHGLRPLDIINAVKSFGKEPNKIRSIEFINQYPKPHNGLKSVTTHHPARFADVWKEGRYLFFVKGHVAAVVDGRVHDWTEGRAKRCVSIYEVK